MTAGSSWEAGIKSCPHQASAVFVTAAYYVAEVFASVVFVTAAFASPLLLPLAFASPAKFVTEACVKLMTAQFESPVVMVASVG